ncbi:lipoprotein-releasing system transmembrane protein LolE-like [Ylistrum balloti]|uniref:lipoprotein-releasing system transmembrane protein LolE-like n=1 Tax=Ylistrum balloti TaxID=509963 RepID=UPI002905C5C3|nr:lipoprotein-releasing system transmembrane protein LolE-like [Ylistrum balloti]
MPRSFFFGKIWRSRSTMKGSHWLIIALAIVPFVMVQQIANNMIEGISLRIIETDTAHLSATLPYTISTEQQQRMLDNVREMPYVNFAYTELRGAGIIKHGKRKSGVLFRGVDTHFLSSKGVSQYLRVLEGSRNITEKNTLLVGSAIAKSLSLSVGDELLLLSSIEENASSLPKISRAKVLGIVSTGYEELDRTWVFMQKEHLQSLLAASDQNWTLGIKISDPFVLENALVQRNARAMKRGRAIYTELQEVIKPFGPLRSWYEKNTSTFTLLLSTKTLLYIALIIAVILALVSLISTTGMRIVDLEIELAILKAIGIDPRQLELQVILRGALSGCIGAIVGTAIGTFLAYHINRIVYILDVVVNSVRAYLGNTEHVSILNPKFYLDTVPFSFYPMNMLASIVVVTFFSMLSSWYPSRKIRNVSCIKLLRRH